MSFKGLSSTQMADAAGIARPTFSQLLSGRNKKISNELISKLHDAFPELDVMWLLFGEGRMLSISNETHNEEVRGGNPPRDISETFTQRDPKPYAEYENKPYAEHENKPYAEHENKPYAEHENKPYTEHENKPGAENKSKPYSETVDDDPDPLSLKDCFYADPRDLYLTQRAIENNLKQSSGTHPDTASTTTQRTEASYEMPVWPGQNDSADKTQKNSKPGSPRLVSIIAIYSDYSFKTYYPSDTQNP